MTTAHALSSTPLAQGGHVAGLGMRSAASATDILAAITAACEAAGANVPQITALATSAKKAQATAVRAVAAQLCIPIVALEQEALRASADRCRTTSAASLEATGLPSLAEAAALAGAGLHAKLLAPRVAHGAATAAIATSAAPVAANNSSLPGQHTP